MTEPITQVSVEAEIYRLAQQAEKALVEANKRLRARAEAEATYKVARAKAYLLSQGPVEERKAHADAETADELATYLMCEAVEKSALEAGRTYRAQLDAFRSLNANLRPMVT